MNVILANSTPEPNSGCWIWTGSLSEKGYGRLSYEGRMFGAHRLSWEMENGAPVPEGMMVCHRCDVRPCVNPAHLFLGDNRANMLDCVAKGRHFMASHPERNVSRKLTDDQISYVRAHASDPDFCFATVARQFGVGRLAVSRLARGLTFKEYTPLPAALAGDAA